MAVEPTVDHLITRLELDSGSYLRDAAKAQRVIDAFAANTKKEFEQIEQSVSAAASAISKFKKAQKDLTASDTSRLQKELRIEKLDRRIARTDKRLGKATSIDDRAELSSRLATLQKEKAIVERQLQEAIAAQARAKINLTKASGIKKEAEKQKADAQSRIPGLTEKQKRVGSWQGALTQKNEEYFKWVGSIEGKAHLFAKAQTEKEQVKAAARKLLPEKRAKTEDEIVKDLADDRLRKRRIRAKVEARVNELEPPSGPKSVEQQIEERYQRRRHNRTINEAVSARERAERAEGPKTLEQQIEEKYQKRRHNRTINEAVAARERSEREAETNANFYSGPLGKIRKLLGMRPQSGGGGSFLKRGLSSLGMPAELAEMAGPLGLVAGGMLALGAVLSESVKYTARLVKSLNVISYQAEESGYSGADLMAIGQVSEQWGGSASGARAAATQLEQSLYALKTGGGVSSQLLAMGMYGVSPYGANGKRLSLNQLYMEEARALSHRSDFSTADKFMAARAMGADTGMANAIAAGPQKLARALREQEAQTKNNAAAIKDSAQATRAWNKMLQQLSNLWAQVGVPIFTTIEEFIANLIGGAAKDTVGTIKLLKHPITQGAKDGEAFGRWIANEFSSHGPAQHPVARKIAQAQSALSGRGLGMHIPAIPSFASVQAQQAAYLVAAAHARLPAPIPRSAISNDYSVNVQHAHLHPHHVNNVEELMSSIGTLSRKQTLNQSEVGL